MPNSILSIRKADFSDEGSFVALNIAFMQEVQAENPYWTSLSLPTHEAMGQRFRDALARPDQIQIFVAEFEGRVVGYANTWTVFSMWSGGKALTIDDLYINSSYRRSGFGDKMVEYLVQFAEKLDYTRVQLHAEVENTRAHNLYEKFGFSRENILFFMKPIQINAV